MPVSVNAIHPSWVTMFRRSLLGRARRVSTLATANPASAVADDRLRNAKARANPSSLCIFWNGPAPALRRHRPASHAVFHARLSAVNAATSVGPQNDSCRATRATFMGLCSETVPGKRASRLSGARCVFPRHGRRSPPARSRAGAGSPPQFRERPFRAPPTFRFPRHRRIGARRADARIPAFRRRTPHPGSRMRGTSA
jgi:hypothetical protein